MQTPGMEAFDYDYERFEDFLDSLEVIVREAMVFIAKDDSLDSFMSDLAFNKGEPKAAQALRSRMEQAGAPPYLLAALSDDDLLLIIGAYNHPISLLLRERY